MCFRHLLSSLILLVAASGAFSSKIFRGQVSSQHHVQRRIKCFQNTSLELCQTLLRAYSQEIVREDSVAKNFGRQRRRLLDGQHADTAPERLMSDCEEPENPPPAVEGGPDEIFCCRTAELLVADLEKRKEHCDSDPPVDCWDSLIKILPSYLEYYSKRKERLCRTTTTTTLTTTTQMKKRVECPPPPDDWDEEYWIEHYDEVALDESVPCKKFPDMEKYCPKRCHWTGKKCEDKQKRGDCSESIGCKMSPDGEEGIDEEYWEEHYEDLAVDKSFACSKFPHREKYCPKRCHWTGEVCEDEKIDMQWCFDACKMSKEGCDHMCAEAEKRMKKMKDKECKAAHP